MDFSVTPRDAPFRATDIKIKRARQHLAELEEVAKAYLASDSVKIGSSIEGRQFTIIFGQIAVPDIVSAITGDILHNLRTSLDVMACELCRDERAAFPFCKREESLEETIKTTRFNKAGREAEKLVRELRPYVGGNVALRAIHDLDIQDKHRALIPPDMSIGGPIIDTWTNKFVGDPTKPSDLKFLFPADSPFGQAEIIPTLHELVETAAGIIESFKHLAVPAG